MVNQIPPRYWGQNIIISGNGFLLSGQSQQDRLIAIKRAEAFQSEVQDVLRWLEMDSKTQTGNLLLKAINQTTGGKTLRIVPYREANANARTIPSLPRRAIAADEGFKQFKDPVKDTGDGKDVVTVNGTGEGTNVVIAYDPRDFMCARCFRSLLPSRRFHADDVFFHELVHALRMMRGLGLTRNILQAADRVPFDEPEEFVAILLTSIYVSENGGTLDDIRIDHDPVFHSIADSDVFQSKTSSAYYYAYQQVIAKVAKQMDDLIRPIGNLTSIEWNPLVWHYTSASDLQKLKSSLQGASAAKVAGPTK